MWVQHWMTECPHLVLIEKWRPRERKGIIQSPRVPESKLKSSYADLRFLPGPELFSWLRLDSGIQRPTEKGFFSFIWTQLRWTELFKRQMKVGGLRKVLKEQNRNMPSMNWGFLGTWRFRGDVSPFYPHPPTHSHAHTYMHPWLNCPVRPAS